MMYDVDAIVVQLKNKKILKYLTKFKSDFWLVPYQNNIRCTFY